jgi:hypothetical protein
MEYLIIATAAFVVGKHGFQFLAWLALTDSDAVYRRHLDTFWDVLHKSTLFDLALILSARISKRLKLNKFQRWDSIWLIVFLIAITANYLALVISFGAMIRDNSAFVFEGKSIPYTIWNMYRFPGFWSSQQFRWMLIFNTLLSITAFAFSTKLLSRIKSTISFTQLFTKLIAQLVILLIAMAGCYISIYSGVYFYDWHSNTETQQYLLTQTERMLAAPDPLFIFILFLLSSVSILPSVLFLLLLKVLLLIKLVPSVVQRFLSHVIFRITTDKEPVIGQLGSLLGGLAAICTAIIIAMKGVAD